MYYKQRGVDSIENVDTYIERIVDTYSAMLIRLAYASLHNQCDAEDIVQEAMVRLMKAQPRFDSEEHEKAWLIRVTINLCKNHLKSGWVTKTVVLDESLSVNEPDGILDIVMQLPQNYRNAIYLHYYEGYSTAELAAMLGKRQATICSWLQRARGKLRQQLVELE